MCVSSQFQATMVVGKKQHTFRPFHHNENIFFFCCVPFFVKKNERRANKPS